MPRVLHDSAQYYQCISLMHISFLAVPEAPQNVRAAEVSPPIENVCIILVTWDPPANTDQSDIDRYIVYVPSRNITDIESSAISVLRIPNCRSDDTIQVAAVNRFECVGMNSSKIQPNLFNDSAQTSGSTTSTPIESTSTAGKYCMNINSTITHIMSLTSC